MLVSFNNEIFVTRKYKEHGLELVRGKEKISVLNNYEKCIYLELTSLVDALGVSINKFLEVIGYNPVLRGHLAYYREESRLFKVINVECLNLLFRNLASGGYHIEMLKVVKEQINKALSQFERELNRI